MNSLHIKKGDEVYVNSGNDKGQKGKVLQVLIKEKRAIVEGVNKVKKSQKPSAKYPQGGIIEMEAPIQVSKLNRIVDGKPVRSNGKARKVNVK
jgi:large subunit ribosomal protein L24